MIILMRSCITDGLYSQQTMHNNIHIIMTPKCFNTFVPSSGSSKVVVHSSYVVSVLLKFH